MHAGDADRCHTDVEQEDEKNDDDDDDDDGDGADDDDDDDLTLGGLAVGRRDLGISGN